MRKYKINFSSTVTQYGFLKIKSKSKKEAKAIAEKIMENDFEEKINWDFSDYPIIPEITSIKLDK